VIGIIDDHHRGVKHSEAQDSSNPDYSDLVEGDHEMASPCPHVPRPKESRPGVFQGGFVRQNADFLVHNSVGPFPRFALRGLDLQPELPRNVPADKTANAVTPPVPLAIFRW
jgi:hypothetical protein